VQNIIQAVGRGFYVLAIPAGFLAKRSSWLQCVCVCIIELGWNCQRYGWMDRYFRYYLFMKISNHVRERLC